MNKKQKYAFIEFIESVPGEIILYSIELAHKDTKYHKSVYTVLKYSPESVSNRILDEMADAASWEEGKFNGMLLLAEVGFNRLKDSPKDAIFSKMMFLVKNHFGVSNLAKLLSQEFKVPFDVIDKNYIDWLCTMNNKRIETISQELFEECVKDLCIVIAIDQRLKLKRVLMSFGKWPFPPLNKLLQVFMESEILGTSE